MDIVTRLNTYLHGRLVGTDADGNQYYTDKRVPATGRTRRWVVYAGPADASAVPPDCTICAG